MNALDLLYIPLAAATAPVWARKARGGWSERFGKGEPLKGDGPRILLHAVSVGEVNALRELVPLLVGRARVVVSAGTDTGLARAKELFGKTCDVVRYPLDFSWSVRRFLDRVRPDVVGLVELELWPNFVRACEGRGIPVCVVNGRLSARSFKGYRRARALIGPTFRRLTFAAVQDEDYAARFEAMGVAPTDCLITGSMKWDSAKIEVEGEVGGARELAREMGISRDAPLIVAGSTGPGEEALMMGAAAEVEREIGPVQLLCAPRKPERFEEAAGVMGGCVRRTETKRGEKTGEVEPPPPRPKAAAAPPPGGEDGERASRRFLLDTIGELRKAYALADVVVVGRSFGDQYGSDPVEPIALGRATVIGPAVSDFAQIVAAFERGGGIVRATRESLAGELCALLKDRPRREAVAERGRGVIRSMQGASARHAELLVSLLKEREGR